MQKKPPLNSSSLPPAKVRPGTRAASRQRRAISRPAKDERGARLAWYVGGGVVLLVILMVGFGYYNDNIGPARDTAISVGGRSVSMGYYRDRLRAAAIAAGKATQVDAYNMESTTTTQLEQEQVYLQGSSSLGVTVSENDITLAIAKDVHATVADNKVSDPAQLETLVRNQLLNLQLTLAQERQLATAAALQQKVLDKFTADVPKQALSVQGLELTFTSADQANKAKQQIQSGDAPEDVATDMKTDPSLGSSQTVDWTPVPFGVLPDPVDRFAASAQPGDISDVIQANPPSGAGSPQWYIFKVTARDANHDVAAAQTTDIAQKKQQAWFDSEKQALNVHSNIDTTKGQWAAQHTGLPLQASPTPTPPARPSAAPSAPAGAPIGPQPISSAPAAPVAPPGGAIPPSGPAVPPPAQPGSNGNP